MLCKWKFLDFVCYLLLLLSVWIHLVILNRLFSKQVQLLCAFTVQTPQSAASQMLQFRAILSFSDGERMQRTDACGAQNLGTVRVWLGFEVLHTLFIIILMQLTERRCGRSCDSSQRSCLTDSVFWKFTNTKNKNLRVPLRVGCCILFFLFF